MITIATSTAQTRSPSFSGPVFVSQTSQLFLPYITSFGYLPLLERVQLLSTSSASFTNKRLPETPAQALAQVQALTMSSRRTPPTLQGQQQLPSLPSSQSQQQVQRNDTSGVSAPAPAPVSIPGVGTTPISPRQVIALVRDAWKKAVGGDEARSANPDGPISGLTLDLTGKNIPTLPEEVIDILRNGVER